MALRVWSGVTSPSMAVIDHCVLFLLILMPFITVSPLSVSRVIQVGGAYKATSWARLAKMRASAVVMMRGFGIVVVGDAS